MIGAGDLKTRARFLRRAEDEAGDRLGAWTEEFSRLAKVEYLRGGEGVMAQRLAGEQPVVLSVRTCSLTRALNTDWRAKLDGGAEYGIRSVQPNREAPRDFIDLLCASGGPRT